MRKQRSEEVARVERALADELSQIETPADAERVARDVETLAEGTSAGERGARAAQAPAGPGEAVEQAAQQRPGLPGVAATLAETAAQVAAPAPTAHQAARAAADLLPPGDADARGTMPTAVERSPRARRGRRLLREVMLRRMGPLQAFDARVFLAINGLPHPPAANVAADTITLVTTGGWIWLVGLAVARARGVRGSTRAFRLAAPCILGATSMVEWPIKTLFRRKRPFIDVVRALVVGRRPDGWSFPSGHTAAAFSGAWVLSTLWPRRAPWFFALAASVGFSRVYVGAHYPGDVLSGATLGMVLAEAIRRPMARLLR